MAPLSNDTLSQRIKDMSSNVKSTTVQRVRNCPCCALQLDESTNISSLSVLFVFAHYVEFKKKFCFATHLKNIQQGEIFSV